MDIISHEPVDARLLDAVARAALGKATSGVSTGPTSRIHLLAMNMPEQQRASDVLNNFGSLTLIASTTAMSAGAPDPVISCADDAIAADAQVAWLALRGDEEIKRGTLKVVNGACSLRLTKPKAGHYTILFYRLRGNFASGTAEFRVDPA